MEEWLSGQSTSPSATQILETTDAFDPMTSSYERYSLTWINGMNCVIQKSSDDAANPIRSTEPLVPLRLSPGAAMVGGPISFGTIAATRSESSWDQSTDRSSGHSPPSPLQDTSNTLQRHCVRKTPPASRCKLIQRSKRTRYPKRPKMELSRMPQRRNVRHTMSRSSSLDSLPTREHTIGNLDSLSKGLTKLKRHDANCLGDTQQVRILLLFSNFPVNQQSLIGLSAPSAIASRTVYNVAPLSTVGSHGVSS